jgi:serine/threonine protein kinase
MQGGELFDRIVKKSSYNEAEARATVRILLDAISFCHSQIELKPGCNQPS